MHLHELEQGTLKLRCSNVMDKRIPIASVATSPFGLGVAVDALSNARFYDLYRFRKMCKVSSNVRREEVSTASAQGKAAFSGREHQFRLLPSPCLEMGEEQMVVVVSSGAANALKSEEGDEPPPPAEGEEPAKPVPPESDTGMAERTVQGETRVGLDEVRAGAREVPFLMNKATVSIFKFEEVLLYLYPHLGTTRRRSLKEVFAQEDPEKRRAGGANAGGAGASTVPGRSEQYATHTSGFRAIDDPNSTRREMKSVTSSYSKRSGADGSVGFEGEAVSATGAIRFEAGQSRMQEGSKKGRSELGAADASQEQQYNIPTIQLLNPQLYREQQRALKQVKNQTFECLKHLKERYSYHEVRQQRVQKRTEDIARELEAKHEEEMMLKTKRRKMSVKKGAAA